MNWLKTKYNRWLISKLLKFSGVDVTPEVGIWGVIQQNEEQETLAEIYKNTNFISLLKKYAEVSNKAVLSSLNPLELGKFLMANGIILKARRAFKQNESKPKHN